MKILIVKLGAMGDVLRTTPLLPVYRKIHPKANITWVVDAPGRTLLERNPYIDRLWVYNDACLKRLAGEAFDLAVNLDKEKEALDCIAAARADVKKGFGWNGERTGLIALNTASEYAVRLGLDDTLKFRTNQKTYQEFSFEQVEIPYDKEEYVLPLDPSECRRAKKLFTGWKIPHPEEPGVIGLNTGSGDRFAGKRLPVETIVELSKRIHDDLKCPVLLLGGPEEHDRNRVIEDKARGYAINAGTHYSIREFAALVSHLALVVTGDTIAMHVAIAAKIPALVYFGSTSAPEIELYGRGKKLVSALDCAPCYKRDCPIREKCMSDLSVTELLSEIKTIMSRRDVRKNSLS